MSHGIHGHHGHHGHSHGQHLGVKRHGSGEFKKLGKEGGAAPAAPAAQPGQAGGIDEAMSALDQAIKGLAVSLQKDSYNGQAAPEGAQPVNSGLTNPGNLQADTYTPATAPAPAPAPKAGLSVNDPILNAKGGGGLSGGVVGSYLNALGGGGLSGGVVGSRL